MPWREYRHLRVYGSLFRSLFYCKEIFVTALKFYFNAVNAVMASWMATLKNDLSLHNLTFEDAVEMALDKPLWGLLAASGATH